MMKGFEIRPLLCRQKERPFDRVEKRPASATQSVVEVGSVRTERRLAGFLQTPA